MRQLPEDFARSMPLRVALKRGLARQALSQAEAAQADLCALFQAAASAGTSDKARERLARRLGGGRGIVRVGLGEGGRSLAVTARNGCDVLTRAAGRDIHSERALLYTRVVIRPGRTGAAISICRASFGPHALERLVERGGVALDRPLLPVADAEATALLRAMMRGEIIDDQGDQCLRAMAPGLWAGSLDEARPDPDWPLKMPAAAGVPLFSARTFLGEAEMRPTLWLRWRDDPGLTLH